jgi:hypothetical protein
MKHTSQKEVEEKENVQFYVLYSKRCLYLTEQSAHKINVVIVWNARSRSQQVNSIQFCACSTWYCDMHAVGQQSTVETLFITVAKQRNNGSDQRFLWGSFPGYITDGSNSCCRVQLDFMESRLGSWQRPAALKRPTPPFAEEEAHCLIP